MCFILAQWEKEETHRFLFFYSCQWLNLLQKLRNTVGLCWWLAWKARKPKAPACDNMGLSLKILDIARLKKNAAEIS